MSRWRRFREHLDGGADLKAAAASAGCSPAEIARLTSKSSGAWSYLLDDVDRVRILIFDDVPSSAARHLAERGAAVAQADDDPDRSAVRRRLAAGRAEGMVGSAGSLLRQQWDVVCFDSFSLQPGLVRSAVSALAPGGRVVVVADNRLSPVRFVDQMFGGFACRFAVARLSHITGLLAAQGLAVRRVYGLLRSSVHPVTAFDVDAPSAAGLVLSAAATNVSGLQRRALGLFSRFASAGWSAPLVPAWAVIGSAGREPGRSPVVGHVGYDWTKGAKILFGEPPRELEKWYRTRREAAAEAMALTALAEAGLDIGPRLLSRPAARACRMTWCSGRPLSVKSLSHSERARWVVASAELLRLIHDATRRSDGSVLVHGDYWLGNLLVAGGDVSAVIDWGAARWGSAATDAKFLVDSLADYYGSRPDLLDDLRTRRDLAYSG